MKKALSIIAFIICLATSTSAQSFKKGSEILSIATGYSVDYGLHTSAIYEWGIKDLDNKSSIGVEAYLGYAMADKSFDYYDADCGMYCNRDMFIAVGANYHHTAIKNLDLYGGFRIGYDLKFDFIDWDDETFEFIVGDVFPVEKSKMAYDIHVGARYSFWKRFTVNAEVGYGLSLVNLGLGYKF